jgi:P-type Mg2+ transporter
MPLIKTMASWPIVLVSILGISTLTFIPYTALGRSLGFVALPSVFFLWLSLIILAYLALATLVKYLYIRIHQELL